METHMTKDNHENREINLEKNKHTNKYKTQET